MKAELVQAQRCASEVSGGGISSEKTQPLSELEDNRAEELPTGHVVSKRYEITGMIGHGSLGVVYKANDREKSVDVALRRLPKVVSEDSDFVQNLYESAERSKTLIHPNLVRFLGVENTPEGIFIVTEFVDGPNLKELLSTRGRFTWSQIAMFADQLCRATFYAHTMQVVHGNITPSNILRATKEEIKLADIRCGAAVTSATSRKSQTASPRDAYTAPEVLAGGAPSAAADQYSIAVVLYELVAGKLPYTDSDEEWPLEQLDGAPHQVNTAVFRALSRDPKKRYSSTEALAETFLAGSAVGDAFHGDFDQTEEEILPKEKQQAMGINLDESPRPLPLSKSAGSKKPDVQEPVPFRRVVIIAVGLVAFIVLFFWLTLT